MTEATIVSVGTSGVSVGTNGGLTGRLLDQFASALAASAVVTVAANASLPASDGNYDQALIIPSTDSGSISVPSGYEFVVYQGTSGSLVATDPREVIIGDLTYSGGAGTVISYAGDGGTVSDTAPGALLAFAGNANSVTAAGAGQTVQIDGTANFVVVAADSVTVQANAAGDLGGNTVSLAGSVSAMFLGNSNTNTIYGGGGSDTVIAGSAVYHGGTGSDLFVGGTGSSTVFGATNETIFSNTGGGVYSLAANSNDFVVAHGGAGAASLASDTVVLAAGSVQAQVWGNSNESMSIGGVASATGALVVAYGSNDSISLANTTTAGPVNNEVVAWNVNYGQTAFTGNTTLTASDGGHDIFVMFGSLSANETAAAAHTIVINNWQASDLLDLSSGYSTADVQTAQQAIAGGASSFTLADGTTVQFSGGAKPTAGQIYHQ